MILLPLLAAIALTVGVGLSTSTYHKVGIFLHNFNEPYYCIGLHYQKYKHNAIEVGRFTIGLFLINIVIEFYP